ncbi:MAG: helix-turn-helix domain-containing GNAT family N-acetyltransferase [Lentisphaerales bacterium]|nr:helix-turn-helix domain-containing GNAT family N-acetyltransferase [Lentisphaerales bacterium]
MSLSQDVVSIRESILRIIREAEIFESNDFGLGQSHCQILLELQRLHTSTIIELSRLLSQNKSTTSRNIKFLQKQQYIMQLVDPTDNRLKPYTLTKKGRDLVAMLDERAAEAIIEALGILQGEELKKAVEGLELFSGALYHSRLQSKYTIREITASDNIPLGKIILQVLAEFNARELTSVYEDEEVRSMHEVYSKNDYIFYTALKGDLVKGGVGISPLLEAGKHCCEVRKMYLLPDDRGFGLGKKLLVRCLDQARSNGYRTVYAKTATRMPQAITLFQKMDFKVTASPIKEDAKNHSFIWLSKSL